MKISLEQKAKTCQLFLQTQKFRPVPLEFNAIVHIRCICKEDKTAKKRNVRESWGLSELQMKTTTECSYLEQFSFFYLYHRWNTLGMSRMLKWWYKERYMSTGLDLLNSIVRALTEQMWDAKIKMLCCKCRPSLWLLPHSLSHIFRSKMNTKEVEVAEQMRNVQNNNFSSFVEWIPNNVKLSVFEL